MWKIEKKEYGRNGKRESPKKEVNIERERTQKNKRVVGRKGINNHERKDNIMRERGDSDKREVKNTGK